MTRQVIQDWTNSEANPVQDGGRQVKYLVFREGESIFQEITETDGKVIHTLELPDGLVLEKSSYEVMLRYALTDVINS